MKIAAAGAARGAEIAAAGAARGAEIAAAGMARGAEIAAAGGGALGISLNRSIASGSAYRKRLGSSQAARLIAGGSIVFAGGLQTNVTQKGKHT